MSGVAAPREFRSKGKDSLKAAGERSKTFQQLLAFLWMNWRYLTRAVAVCLLVGAAVGVRAQNTASSSLVVSMSVQSSISLEFVNVSGAGSQGTCIISGAGTSAASVNFGIASIAGDNQSCVSFSKNGQNYTLSNDVYAVVTQSNLSSSNYSLTASLGSAAPTGVTWAINSATLSTASTSVTTGGTYGSNLALYLQVTVAGTVTATNLSETINFTATAN